MDLNNFHRILLLLACLAILGRSECSKESDEFLVTFHPHLDAFWLNTDDELKDINFRPAGFLYAMNQRNAKVILNSMLESLKKNQQRKYFISEIVFFKDWFQYLNADQKKQVENLFKKGQLEIANAGWVQNDEAVCYMDDIIDQYTIGNNYLHSRFGIKTKIGWATDSFGHSHSQAAILHLLGFQFQGIERIDDRYIYERKDNPLLEFYWSPVSDSNNRKYGGVFTHVRHFLHEVNDLRRTSESAVKKDFTDLKQNMKKLYKTNRLFRFLGNDFEEFIPQQFQMLQSSFKTLNSNPQCPEYKYGNPSDYLQRLKELFKNKAAVRQYDFMPNYDQDHYWSGYFTTNPELKKVCKDFSRIVNLLRKIYVSHITKGDKQPKIYQLIVKSDELLSVMQHHDGITATSKYHIEELFKGRMLTKIDQIIKAIGELKQYPKQHCKIYQDSNICKIESSEQKVYLSIIHEGGKKTQRIQLVFMKDTFYDIAESNDDEIFCHPVTQECSLVFEAELRAGENVFVLNKVDKSKALNTIKADGNTFTNNDFSVNISDGHRICYSFNKQFIKIFYVRSLNQRSSTDSQSWDKYGNKQGKTEGRLPGIYIMSNNGNLWNYQLLSNTLHVTNGKIFTKIYFPGKRDITVTITVKNSERNIIDLRTKFIPGGKETFDYFIQVSTDLDSKGQFYHDSNGYLVSKRKVGERPDYNWNYKKEDKINANTYPMCSFAYAIDGDKKLVIFTDRAQGFAQYDSSYLINIDRLADDDYKGVAEGYRIQKENIFHHKIGLVKSSSFIERQWQKAYDEPLLAFYSNAARKSSAQQKSSANELAKYVKHTVFNLNQDEFVLRLFNLAQKEDLKLPKHSSTEWSIPELDLNLAFAGIKETFANGIELSEKTVWKKIEGQINTLNLQSKDTKDSFVLSPLQVRSFRVNLKGMEAKKPVSQPKQEEKAPPKQTKQQSPPPPKVPSQTLAQQQTKPQRNPRVNQNDYLLDLDLQDVTPIQPLPCDQ